MKIPFEKMETKRSCVNDTSIKKQLSLDKTLLNCQSIFENHKEIAEAFVLMKNS